MKRETLINAIFQESLKGKIPGTVWSIFSMNYDSGKVETDRLIYMRKLIFSSALDNSYQGNN